MSFSATAQAFATASSPGSGEAVCIWQHGKQQLHLCSGEAAPGAPWQEATLVPIFSATKALSAACLLQALDDQELTPEMRIGELWPTFPAPHCSIAQLLSHQTGLAAWKRPASLFDLQDCRAAIESSLPAWGPPQHGYHPHTFGPMVDLLMLQLTGKRIADFWETRVRRPLGLEVYLGLPEQEFARVAALRPPKLTSAALPRDAFYRSYTTPGSPTYRAFHSVTGLASIREMNTPSAWQCACPAKGGIASARGLAMAYQAILGHLPGSPFSQRTLKWMHTPICAGEDLTLRTYTAFSCGAMCAPVSLFGRGGFGHPGAGGFHAFALPGAGLSFAYVTSQMHLGALPPPRVVSLIHTVLQELGCA